MKQSNTGRTESVPTEKLTSFSTEKSFIIEQNNNSYKQTNSSISNSLPPYQAKAKCKLDDSFKTINDIFLNNETDEELEKLIFEQPLEKAALGSTMKSSEPKMVGRSQTKRLLLSHLRIMETILMSDVDSYTELASTSQEQSVERIFFLRKEGFGKILL